jgi:hypothetical protein
MSRLFAVTLAGSNELIYVAKSAVVSLRSCDSYEKHNKPDAATLINLRRESLYVREDIENVRYWVDSP